MLIITTFNDIVKFIFKCHLTQTLSYLSGNTSQLVVVPSMYTTRTHCFVSHEYSTSGVLRAVIKQKTKKPQTAINANKSNLDTIP